MSYSSWSVIAGEQPTTSKWNILGTNDASFNDGTGIANNAIVAAHLATTAISLGYAQITANFLPGTTAETDITGLSVAVTVPAGGRDVLVAAKAQVYNTGGADTVTVAIKEGATVLDQIIVSLPAANKPSTVSGSARISAPSAGSHTYKLSIAGAVSNPAVQATASQKAYILVRAQ